MTVITDVNSDLFQSRVRFAPIQDALLHAIKEEYVEAVEVLLQFEEQRHVAGQPYVIRYRIVCPVFYIFRVFISVFSFIITQCTHANLNIVQSWESVDRSSSTFTPDITPLILAAHKNNYEILKILLDRGASLPMPHDVR